jgi:SAM-dependent methyltransferase
MIEPEIGERISFRDPKGQLLLNSGKAYRAITAAGRREIEMVLALKLFKTWTAGGKLVGSKLLNAAPNERRTQSLEQYNCSWLEHDRIAFASYPYEWPAEMLAEAGRLTLDLNSALLDEGFTLKDATPDNVLFVGPDPVFVDLLSFERRNFSQTVWLPYGQFLRTFVLPLLSFSHFGIPPNMVFLTRRDGLTPEEVYKMCGVFKRFSPGFLGTVTLPKWLAKKNEPTSVASIAASEKSTPANPEKSDFVFRSLLNNLRKHLERAAPKSVAPSAWMDYCANNEGYSATEFEAKERFVAQTLAAVRPRRVLDIGCNTGHFSRIASKFSESVVAVDSDSSVIGKLWTEAHRERLKILPLVVNIARPSPATGWVNDESPSFLERSHQFFDAVLGLAVVHHLLVKERIPLTKIVELLSIVCKRIAIIEYVAPTDPVLTKMRDSMPDAAGNISLDIFKATFEKHFDVERECKVTPHRCLLLLRKRI